MSSETIDTQSHPGLALSRNTLVSYGAEEFIPRVAKQKADVFRCQYETGKSLFKTWLPISFTVRTVGKKWTAALEPSSHIIQPHNHHLNNTPQNFSDFFFLSQL